MGFFHNVDIYSLGDTLMKCGLGCIIFPLSIIFTSFESDLINYCEILLGLVCVIPASFIGVLSFVLGLFVKIIILIYSTCFPQNIYPPLYSISVTN